MSYPEWPADLPQPLRDSWSDIDQDPRLVRSAETGPPSYRRRYTAVPRRIDLGFMLNPEQCGILRFFFRETIKRGTQAFWMPDPVADGLPLLDETGTPLLDENGAQLLDSVRLLCLWGDAPPQFGALRGNRHRVTFSVWDMPL